MSGDPYEWAISEVINRDYRKTDRCDHADKNASVFRMVRDYMICSYIA